MASTFYNSRSINYSINNNLFISIFYRIDLKDSEYYGVVSGVW